MVQYAPFFCFFLQVTFLPLNVNSKERMLRVLSAVDKANGFCFSGAPGGSGMRSLASTAVGDTQFEYARTGEVRERFVKEEGGGGGEGEGRKQLWNDLDKVEINSDFQV